MQRQIKFKNDSVMGVPTWDQDTVRHFAEKYAPAAIRLLDGLTLEAYAGSVPPNWDGRLIEVFDMFEARRLKLYHPELYEEYANAGAG